ncbi:MAG: hypothetical protein WC630_01375 [Candidatus Babeliales bacterium]
MRYILQTMLFAGMLFFHSLNACYGPNEIIEFTESEVFVPAKLGNLRLYKDGEGFYVIKDGMIYDVQSCFCDRMLRKVSDEQLLKFLGRDKPQIIILSPEKFSQLNPGDMVEITVMERERLLRQLSHRGYISVNQTDDGEYILRIEHRLLGGGFWKILTWAGIGAIGCASAAAGGAEMLEASGHQVSLGPVLIVHSVIGAIGGGIIAILAGGSSSGQQQEDHPTTYGTDTVSVNTESVTARLLAPQASNPIAGPNKVYAEDTVTIPFELEIVC